MLRLYPALIVAVLVFTPLGLVKPFGTGAGSVGVAAVASLTYLNDFVRATGHSSGYFDVTWSLAVEEQFYLIWPLVLLFVMHRMAFKRIGPMLLTLGLLAAVISVPLAQVVSYNWMYYSPIGSIPALLLGAALAFRQPHVPRWLVAIAAVVLVGLMATIGNQSSHPLLIAVQDIGAIASLILVAGALDGIPILRIRPLIWLGRRSYGFYLIHLGMWVTLHSYAPNLPHFMYSLVGIPVSLVLAALLYRFIERPFLALKSRLSRVSGEAATTAELGDLAEAHEVDTGDPELRKLLKRRLAIGLAENGWLPAEPQPDGTRALAHFVRPSSEGIAATARFLTRPSGSSSITIQKVLIGVSFEPLRRRWQLLGEHYSLSVLPELDCPLHELFAGGVITISNEQDVDAAVTQLVPWLTHAAAAEAAQYPDLDALLPEVRKTARAARTEVALFAAAGRLNDAGATVGRYRIQPDRRDETQVADAFAQQVSRILEPGSGSPASAPGSDG